MPQSLSIVELLRLFPDDATAEAWFVEQRWPTGIYCPACGSLDILHCRTRKPQPYRCRDCRKHFSVKTGTLMHGSNLGCQTWAIAIYLLTTHPKGVASLQLHKDLAITQKTAWYLAHRIRETWREDPPLVFAGPVEVDETFVGGKRLNRSKRQRREERERLGERGPVGKAIVVGAKDRASGKVSAAVVANRDQSTLHRFVEIRTQSGSKVYTDHYAGYMGMRDRSHKKINRNVGEYINDQVHTNSIESFWSMLKRGYVGTYHYMSPKHLHRYANEFAGRHNSKDLSTLDQMRAMAANMEGRLLTYEALTYDQANQAATPEAEG